MLALDSTLRGMPGAAAWLDADPRRSWREQFLFNLALAKLDCAVELDGRYNVQLHTTRVESATNGPRPAATWGGRAVAVLHLNGTGRGAHPELTGRYVGAGQPLAGAGPAATAPAGDAYCELIRALRRWVGYVGLDALAWSFYSTRDGLSAHVSDPSTLPVLALLHHLIRANGCRRVIETGTARGVSTACIAAAIAHRPGAQVVAFDPLTYAGRDELWSELPPAIRAVIDERREDSIAGMHALLPTGERFDAALLDSDQSEAHVWAEFELARELVVADGLILVHDANSIPDVIATLGRIEQSGFGVTRLMASRAGNREEAGLGLAVIENRLRGAASR
jgi:predicted O-methyltransferase YrrM